MSTVTHHPTRAHRSWGAWAWFTAMAGGWVGFAALLAGSPATLEDLWQGIRDLPLLVEGAVWLLFFPFVLALGIWESSWDGWLRLALVALCAVGWSVASWPWGRSG